jgi:hypothetical protein
VCDDIVKFIWRVLALCFSVLAYKIAYSQYLISVALFQELKLYRYLVKVKVKVKVKMK